MKAHIFILSTGRALAVCEDKGNPSEPCQDGQLPHHGYPGNQTPLLTAAFVGCRPQETKCRFLGVCRRMQNRPPLGSPSWISNYSIIRWTGGSRWQSLPTSSLYFWSPSSGFFSFGLTPSVSVFLLCRKFYDPIEKRVCFCFGFFSPSIWRVWPMVPWEGGGGKPWKKDGQKGPSSTHRTPGRDKGDTNLGALTHPLSQSGFPAPADSSEPRGLCLDSSFKVHYLLKLLR